MEWNCSWSVNTVTPFLFESTGDSEELIKSDVHQHHDHQEEEAVMDESEDVSYRFDDHGGDLVGDDDDDDAQSCSYDNSSYNNTTYGDSQNDLMSQTLTYDDEDANIDDDGNVDFDDENMTESSKQQKRSHKFCVDSLDQREIDRQFWEACLAT